MGVYKEQNGSTWRVIYRYTDWKGERKQTQKRGFKTKREAKAWEHDQLTKQGADLDMKFKSFIELYTNDLKMRLKENTWATKEHIIVFYQLLKILCQGKRGTLSSPLRHSCAK